MNPALVLSLLFASCTGKAVTKAVDAGERPRSIFDCHLTDRFPELSGTFAGARYVGKLGGYAVDFDVYDRKIDWSTCTSSTTTVRRSAWVTADSCVEGGKMRWLDSGEPDGGWNLIFACARTYRKDDAEDRAKWAAEKRRALELVEKKR